MNYLIPVNNLFNQNEKVHLMGKDATENILTQQILISQLSKGITFEDTNNMDEFERVYVLNKLIEMKKEENQAKQEAIEKMNKVR